MNKVGEYRTLHNGTYITVPLELDIEQIKWAWRPTITIEIADDLKFKYYIGKSSSVSDHSSLWFMSDKGEGYQDRCDYDLIDEYKSIDGLAKQAYDALDKWYKENPKSVTDLATYQPKFEEVEIPEPIAKSDNKIFGEYDDETINFYALFDDKTNEVICHIHGTQKHAIDQVKALIMFFNKEGVKPFNVNTITGVSHQDITFKYKRKSITLVKQ